MKWKKVVGITLVNMKTYYKTTINETVQQSFKDKYNKWNERIKHEKDSHM